MKIIHEVLQSGYFNERPPVLIDIGASGEINPKWKTIAPYSVCVAFDADDREFKITEAVDKKFKKLISFNRLVTAEDTGSANFYLTDSPFCSSLLKPDPEKLAPWFFKSLFEVTKVTTMPTIQLPQALKDAGIEYIDWFKSDTQGTDLRLFKSIGSSFRATILAAEFEPGIMDAYQGEDKLYMVMQEMQGNNFWLSSMNVKGTQRLKDEYKEQVGAFTGERIIRTSPGWAEIIYLKQTASDERSTLLLYIFALVEKQYGFALEVMDTAVQKYQDPIFEKSRSAVLKKIKSEKSKLPMILFKRKFNKLLTSVND
jgi:hypothetical protein